MTVSNLDVTAPRNTAPLGQIAVLGKTVDLYPPTALDLRALLALRSLADAAAAGTDLWAALQPAHVTALCDLVGGISSDHLDIAAAPLDELVHAVTDLLEQVPPLWAPYLGTTLTPAITRLSGIAQQFVLAAGAATAEG